MADTPKRQRSRRQFDDDFKAQAVRLVLDEGKSIGAASRDLDLTESAVREWVKRARADRTGGRTGLTTSERTPQLPAFGSRRAVGCRGDSIVALSVWWIRWSGGEG